jgi:tRNA(Ile2) C34 agmatinyltransferase TiaS
VVVGLEVVAVNGPTPEQVLRVAKGLAPLIVIARACRSSATVRGSSSEDVGEIGEVAAVVQ